jgi:ubiquinol-cytochrome c reductase cytochrome b subunit
VWGQFPFDAFFMDTKDVATWAARIGTVIYFLFFLLMPWYSAMDSSKPEPERVTG